MSDETSSVQNDSLNDVENTPAPRRRGRPRKSENSNSEKSISENSNSETTEENKSLIHPLQSVVAVVQLKKRPRRVVR